MMPGEVEMLLRLRYFVVRFVNYQGWRLVWITLVLALAALAGGAPNDAGGGG